ncbi:hypothetical protein F5141DRAFT_1156529 [Pisolithus sp. B1]|nr:hypothetical protein F5141DRAFT_1156529 [Pisolithus sp. B1]
MAEVTVNQLITSGVLLRLSLATFFPSVATQVPRVGINTVDPTPSINMSSLPRESSSEPRLSLDLKSNSCRFSCHSHAARINFSCSATIEVQRRSDT